MGMEENLHNTSLHKLPALTKDNPCLNPIVHLAMHMLAMYMNDMDFLLLSNAL